MSWRYALTQDYWKLVPAFSGLITKDHHHEWFSLYTTGHIVVRNKYAWDGCSGPLIRDGDKMDVAPVGFHARCSDKDDGIRTTTRGSCIHDCGYQFIELIAEVLGKSIEWVRKVVDRLFRDIIREDGFGMAGLYYAGVRVLGGLWHWARHEWRMMTGVDRGNGSE